MLKEKISLYPNLDKNIEFLNVLKTILNNENSKIKSCFLAYSTSQRFCVFFECEDFEPFSFDFYNYFFDYESSKYKVEKYIKYFSEEDINSLILLFENFTKIFVKWKPLALAMGRKFYNLFLKKLLTILFYSI